MLSETTYIERAMNASPSEGQAPVSAPLPAAYVRRQALRCP
jgi:hypothetical protein